jgi:hypothetical protein
MPLTRFFTNGPFVVYMELASVMKEYVKTVKNARKIIRKNGE